MKIRSGNFQGERAHKANLENWILNGLLNTGKCRGDGCSVFGIHTKQITISVKKKFADYLDRGCISKGNSKPAEGGTRNFIKFYLIHL